MPSIVGQINDFIFRAIDSGNKIKAQYTVAQKS